MRATHTDNDRVNSAVARKAGLAARRRLPVATRERLSLIIIRRLARHAWFRRANTIALYCATPDEVNLDALTHAALRHGKRVLVPLIMRDRRLRLIEITAATRWRHNQFGIPEPLPRWHQPARAGYLPDLCLVPLSAFDQYCHRTGMGGGYYDRLLGNSTRSTKTRFMGVGFGVQQVARIATRSWDVRLHAIATEEGILQRHYR
ncbi:MAG: 5-formyltetrahydrofolate cyclo-ligase [Pseudomonadota bacterium]